MHRTAAPEYRTLWRRLERDEFCLETLLAGCQVHIANIEPEGDKTNRYKNGRRAVNAPLQNKTLTLPACA